MSKASTRRGSTDRAAPSPALPTAPAPGQDTLVIDPVKMNIINRVSLGCGLSGRLHFEGGLLLQGQLDGEGTVHGPLVVWPGGRLCGRFEVHGELYLLGQLGADTDTVDEATVVLCQGTVYVASTGVSTGSLSASRLRMYDGAVLQGPFRTLRHGRTLADVATN